MHVFIYLYSGSLKCPLHNHSYTLRIGVSVMELYGTEFMIIDFNASVMFVLLVLESYRNLH